jgi:hypothetical protein
MSCRWMSPSMMLWTTTSAPHVFPLPYAIYSVCSDMPASSKIQRMAYEAI